MKIAKSLKSIGIVTFASVFLGLNAGCVTPLHRAVNDVEVGMGKDEVLEIMGNPRGTDRHRGQDEWRYLYYKDDRPFVSEIIFRQGFVTKIVPPVSLIASNSDALEDADNLQEFEDAVKKQREKNQSSFKNLEE